LPRHISNCYSFFYHPLLCLFAPANSAQMRTPRRGNGATAILALLLACALPAVCSQAGTSTSTVGGRESTTFSFPNFQKILLQSPDNLTFSSNASVSQDALQIIPDTVNRAQSFLINQAGRVFYATPFVLWAENASNASADGRYVASFSTVFKVNLYRVNGSFKGEGLSFVVASDNNAEPPAGSYGGYLGLTNASTDGLAGNGFAAVELDTVKQSYDPDDNHVALDVNGVRHRVPTPLGPLGILLAPADNSSNHGNYMGWVDYNGTTRHVWVHMLEGESKPATAVLNASLDLSTVLRDKTAYFGFSASTGITYQLNCVRMWNMTVERLLDGSATAKTLSEWKLAVAIAAPCVAAALALGLLVGLYIKKRKKVGSDLSAVANVGTFDLRSIPGVPKEFKFKELRKGTGNFDERMKLGQGGYGVVYRATVPGDNGNSPGPTPRGRRTSLQSSASSTAFGTGTSSSSLVSVASSCSICSLHIFFFRKFGRDFFLPPTCSLHIVPFKLQIT
jgi:hypothetical protein